MDGMVARLAGTSSDRGEYLDAFIDRYADFFCGLGFMWLYRSDPLPLALAAAGMIGSSVMGYARAKGEAVGIDPNVGFAHRHERGVILGLTTVMSPIFDAFVEPGVAHPRHYMVIVGLAIVALLTNVTAVWRAQFVLSRMSKKAPPAKPQAVQHSDEKRVAA
jgi:phosphatidylglycerophosphate synthase